MFLKPSTAIRKIISIQYNTISFKVIMTHYTFCWCGSCCERISLLLLGAKKWPAVNRRFKFRNSKEDNISYKIRNLRPLVLLVVEEFPFDGRLLNRELPKSSDLKIVPQL
jgi:hypothetical protein